MFYCPGCEPNGNKVVSGPVPSPAWCPEHSPAAGDCPDYPALAGDAHYLDCSRKAPIAPEPPAGELGKWLRRKMLEGRTATGDVRSDRDGDRWAFPADPPEMPILAVSG